MNALAVSQAALAQHDTVILLPGFTARSYIEAAAMYRATALTSLPTMIAMVSRETTLLKYTDLSSVSAIRMGSAPVSEGLVEAARRAFPHAVIINGYGTTEAGPIVFSAHPDGRPTPDLSVGVAHPHVELRLVTGDDGETDEGVLQMRCPALMTGYHNLPEETAKALTSDGFYTTGDVFRQDRDGFYYFVRRGDDMFVSGGESVCPGEIEAMLERHPEIHQAVVVPVDDELKFKKPVAFVVARPGAAPSEAAVKAFTLANAAPYLHPRRVWFLPVMPLAGTNKDRPAQPGAARRRAAISGLRVMPTVSFTRALERFLPAPSATVEGATVGAALAAVLATRPALRGYVLDDQGILRRHVAIYVNGRLVDDRVG